MNPKDGDNSERDRRLDEVVTAYLKDIEMGRAPSQPEWLARYPDLAAELATFFAAQEQVIDLAAPLRVAAPATGNDMATAGLSEAALAPGTKIGYFGDYELLDELGRGGMGVVYKARQVSLNRVVALKMILTGQLANDDDVRRFHAEAEAAAKLEHAGIVPVFEVGKYDGHHYFTMAFVEGESLAHRLTQGLPAPREAAELTRMVAMAVAYAHTEGVIHRDLKPANILLDKHGQPRLTDFGLAKRVHAEPGESAIGGLTATGQILGTPSYMPPEQASGQRGGVGPLSDVYSLGAVLYCLLTGRPPFQADNPLDTLLQVLEKEPVSPRLLNAAVPRDLETICLKCLHKEPRKRYATAAALADDLERWLRGEPIQARPVGTSERAWRWCRRNPLVAGLTATTAFVLLAGTGASSYFAIEANEKAKQAQENAARADLKAAEAKANADRADAQMAEAVANAKLAQEQAAAARKEKERADVNYSRFGKDLYISEMRLAQQAWDDARIFRLQELLDGQRPERTAGIDLRGFEWYYLQRLCHTDLFTLRFGTAGGEVAVAYSPDGKYLSTAGYNGVLKVHDAATGQEIFWLKGHCPRGGVVWTAVFSPDSKRLASGTGEFGNPYDIGEIKIWDVAKGELIRDLKGHPNSITGLAFSPDGKRLASSSSDKSVKIWDTATGEEVFKIQSNNRINGVAFSPDGQRLVYVDEYNEPAGNSAGDVKVWNLAARKELVTFKGHAGRLFGVAFNPDGRRVAGIGDFALTVWDIPMGRETLVLQAGTGRNSAVAFSKDGQRLAAGCQSIVKVWNAMNGDELRSFKGHLHGIVSVAFSPTGERLASAGGGGVKMWDLASSQEPLNIPAEGGYWFGNASFSPDGRRLASGTGNGPIKICDAITGEVSRVLKGHSGWVLCVAFSPDGKRLVSASEDKTVKLWDATTGEEIRTLKGFARSVNGVAFSPDGKYVASADGDNQQTSVGQVKVWDATTGHEVRTLKVPTVDKNRPFITSVAFSPDGKRLAAGVTQHSRPKANPQGWEFFSGAVEVWDVATGEEVLFLPDNHHVNGVAFSRDGKRVASACLNGTLKIWDAISGQEICTCKGHTSDAYSVAFTPDGKRIASGSQDGTLRIWDATTGQEAFALRDKLGPVKGVAFSPDGKRLAAAGATLKIWDSTPPTDK